MTRVLKIYQNVTDRFLAVCAGRTGISPQPLIDIGFKGTYYFVTLLIQVHIIDGLFQEMMGVGEVEIHFAGHGEQFFSLSGISFGKRSVQDSFGFRCEGDPANNETT